MKLKSIAVSPASFKVIHWCDILTKFFDFVVAPGSQKPWTMGNKGTLAGPHSLKKNFVRPQKDEVKLN